MNKYAAPSGGAVEQACLAMGTIPGPNDWEIPTPGDQWEKCAFFIGTSQYDARVVERIAGMRTDTTLWSRNRIGRDTYGTQSGSELGCFLQFKYYA